MEFPKPTNRQTAKEKQRSRYETLIFTRLVLLVAVPLLIVGLLCGILYYRSEPARGRAKLGEVAGNASMRMTSVFDGLRSYYLAALRNSSFTWMESCSEIPYSRYSDLRDAQELLRGGTYMDSYVVGYEYINLRYGWVLSNYGTFPLEQMKNQEEIRTFIDNQASQTATLYWVNRTGAAPRQTSSLWLNVSGQCLVARITSAKNGLVGMLLIHLDMEYLSELAGEWKSLGYDVVLLDANGETVTTTDTELAHNVETVYKGAAKVVSAGMGCRCVAGVSRVFTSPEQIASAWHEASEALRSRGAASEEMRQDLTYYTTAEDNHTEHGYDTLLENEIIAAMTACNKRETERLIGVFLERLEEKGVRGYERMFYLQRLVSTLLMVAENAGLSVSKVLSNHSDNLFAEISRIYSNDKMRTFLVEEVAVPVMDLLGNFRRDNTSELVKNVIALIKQTNGDLTLNECAEKLNYSASYIWKVLKNERNTNFTDLVASQKLEMAKELLLTTDMSVAQVADTLHYSNVQNFIRFFSREVGMTPGKYKKEYQTGKKKP